MRHRRGRGLANEYITDLHKMAREDPRIIFTGYVFGDGYLELGSNGYAFIETSEVGGTHPALVEEMAFGNCVVTNNTPENMETIGDAGCWYEGTIGADSLKEVLGRLLSIQSSCKNTGIKQENVHLSNIHGKR